MGLSTSKSVDTIPEPRELPGSKDEQQALRTKIGGLHTPAFDREAYEEARRGANGTETWNVDACGKPVAIANCRSAEDVSACVVFYASHCKKEGIPLCVAGGRHSHQCMVNGSFVIDLSGLKGVDVNEAEKYADVKGGSLQGDLDSATEKYNLATTAGHVASTGCGGLILQGGHGYLERRFGLVVDNLLQIEIVVASGEVVTADEKQHSDLFWAVKGGGGNFGVVTRFRLRLHPISSKVFAGQRIHVPIGKGWFPDRPHLIEQFVKVTVGSDDDKATGLLVLPCGGPVVENLVYVDEPEAGEAYFKQHRASVGYPLRDNMKAVSYHSGVQRFAPAGGGNFYMSGLLAPELTPSLAKKLGELSSKANSPGKGTNSAILVLPMGGAVAKKAEGDTANPHRSPQLWILLQGEWYGNIGTAEYEQRRQKVVDWTKLVREQLKEDITGHYGVLADVEAHDEAAEAKGDDQSVGHRDVDIGQYKMMMGTRNVYGPNLGRLQRIKHKYDPENLFQLNDNIVPRA